LRRVVVAIVVLTGMEQSSNKSMGEDVERNIAALVKRNEDEPERRLAEVAAIKDVNPIPHPRHKNNTYDDDDEDDNDDDDHINTKHSNYNNKAIAITITITIAIAIAIAIAITIAITITITIAIMTTIIRIMAIMTIML